MVEIRYGENYDVADLGGKSVAKAREQYEAKFDIPARARARVNGRGIARRHEARAELGADDKVVFAEKSRKGLLFIGSILLALMVSGGVFAFTATTDVLDDMLLTKKDEFATVTKEASPPDWNVWGHYKGKMTAGTLFTIDPEDAYTGDLSVAVGLANAEELVKAYRVFVCKIEIHDSTPAAIAGTTAFLTLGKGEVIIDVTYTASEPYTVELVSGFYISHHAWNDGEEDPDFMCDVAQKGVM